MTYRVSRLSVVQTSKVVAIVYGLLGLIYIPLGALIETTAPPEDQLGMTFWLLLPVLIAVFAFVVGVVGCALYNWIAGWAGGVEFTLEAVDGGAAGDGVKQPIH